MKDICRDKKCHHRHPKLCRYKDTCRRISTCLYTHNDNKRKDNNSDLEVELEIVKAKLEKTTKLVVEITDQNEKYKETV